MRRRLLIFALLGPPIGFVVVRYGLLFDTINGFEWQQFILLPMIYAIGLVPALAVAGVDQLLASKGVRWRALWTAASGYLAAFIPILVSILHFGLTSPYVLLWGVVGAIPAFVCSILSGAGKSR